jgi:hypothetical protein
MVEKEYVSGYTGNGESLYSSDGTANTSKTQYYVDRLRGRVMSIWKIRSESRSVPDSCCAFMT